MSIARIDVSRRRGDKPFKATLRLDSAMPDDDPRSMLARFRRAVSQWLANTPEGEFAWGHAGKDFNYGDLMEAQAKDGSLDRFLEANGLVAASVRHDPDLDLGLEYDDQFFPEDATP